MPAYEQAGKALVLSGQQIRSFQVPESPVNHEAGGKMGLGLEG